MRKYIEKMNKPELAKLARTLSNELKVLEGELAVLDKRTSHDQSAINLIWKRIEKMEREVGLL